MLRGGLAGRERKGTILTGPEALWPVVLLASAWILLLAGLLLLAAGLVVPLALAVLKAAFVGWAARAVLERLDAGKREPARRGPEPVGAPPRPKADGRPHEPFPPRPREKGRP